MTIGLCVDDFVLMGSIVFDLDWKNQKFDPSSRWWIKVCCSSILGRCAWQGDGVVHCSLWTWIEGGLLYTMWHDVTKKAKFAEN